MKRWEVLSLLKADFLYRALPWTDLILNEGRFIDDLNVTLSGRLSVICTFLLLATLLGALWIPWLLILAVACMMGLLLINRDLYRFFRKNAVLLCRKNNPLALGLLFLQRPGLCHRVF